MLYYVYITLNNPLLHLQEPTIQTKATPFSLEVTLCQDDYKKYEKNNI